MTEHDGPQGTQLIARVAAVMRALPHGPGGGRRLRDVAQATGLTEPTARRILAALVQERFVARDEASRRYRIGPVAVELGIGAGAHEQIDLLCRPILERTAAITGDTTNLVKRSGNEAICVIQCYGGYPVHVRLEQYQSRFPLGISTAGTVFLGTLPQDEIDEILDQALYDAAVLSRDDIRERLRNMARLGYVDIQDVPIPGIRGLGVSVPSVRGRPVFAVTTAALSQRMPDARVEEVVGHLQDAADLISETLAEL